MTNKTITFEELLDDEEFFNVTYAKIGGSPKFIILKNETEIINFINENIYDMNLFTINDTIIDIDKLIEKYKK